MTPETIDGMALLTAGREAGSEAGREAGRLGTEAGRLGIEAGIETGKDAGREAGRDAGREAGRLGIDAGIDAGREAGKDAGKDDGATTVGTVGKSDLVIAAGRFKAGRMPARPLVPRMVIGITMVLPLRTLTQLKFRIFWNEVALAC